MPGLVSENVLSSPAKVKWFLGKIVPMLKNFVRSNPETAELLLRLTENCRDLSVAYTIYGFYFNAHAKEFIGKMMNMVLELGTHKRSYTPPQLFEKVHYTLGRIKAGQVDQFALDF